MILVGSLRRFDRRRKIKAERAINSCAFRRQNHMKFSYGWFHGGQVYPGTQKIDIYQVYMYLPRRNSFNNIINNFSINFMKYILCWFNVLQPAVGLCWDDLNRKFERQNALHTRLQWLNWGFGKDHVVLRLFYSLENWQLYMYTFTLWCICLSTHTILELPSFFR